MKKLMFAAAALTAGIAMADIVSSDIVGYAQSGLKFGATMVTPQFVSISGVAMDLNTIAPTGDDLSDNVEIQTLDAYGRTVDAYMWNDWMYENACWVDNDMNPVEDVAFNPGQGLWVSGSTDSQGVQTAGKVGTDDVNVQLRFGATATGNPFPTMLSLTDIVPQGDDLSDNVEIQTLDAFGRTVDAYMWNDWMYENACWVDNDMNAVDDVEFSAGQGLWVSGASDSQYLRFPAPEL